MRNGARTCPKCGSDRVQKFKTTREKFLMCIGCSWSRTLFKYPDNEKPPA